MNIVQINAVIDVGSTGRSVRELHDSLRNLNHNSYVFCTNRNEPENGVMLSGSRLSRKVHAFLSRVTGLQGYFSRFATFKIISELEKIHPDVIHLRVLHSNYIHLNGLLRYIIRKKIPLVITLDDCWFFTGHCCHYLEDRCYRWQEKCGKCPAKRKWNTSWFFDRSAKTLKDRKYLFSKIDSLTVIGVSDWVTSECKKSFFKDYARFVRIYNWIDLDLFKLPNLIQSNPTPVVACVAQTWTQKKGVYDILELAKEFSDYTFVVVGKLPKDVSVPSNVEAKGELSNVNDLVKIYQKADVFLHLSYQETFGKVIVEALACGTPAIVYDCAAMPELIGPNCGYVVPVGDLKEAASKMRTIVSQGKERYSDSCALFVKQNFSKETLIKSTLDLYEAIVQKKD